MKTCRAPGFSLIELVVVVAIVGLLSTFVLSALQASRERARRAQCEMQSRQLAQGIQNYVSTFQHMPPGYLGPIPPKAVSRNGRMIDRDNQQIGYIAFLLPYIEETTIYSTIGKDMLKIHSEPHLQFWVVNGDTWKAANNDISILQCPSAPAERPTDSVLLFLNAYHDEAVGKTLLESAPLVMSLAGDLGRTNYLGCGGPTGRLGIPAMDRFLGALANRTTTRYQAITDGSSKTLLIGEAAGEHQGGLLRRAYSWMGCGSMPVGFGFGNHDTWGNFSSFHPNVVGFSFADGSVHFVSTSIDEAVLHALAAIHDDEPAALVLE